MAVAMLPVRVRANSATMAKVITKMIMWSAPLFTLSQGMRRAIYGPFLIKHLAKCQGIVCREN